MDEDTTPTTSKAMQGQQLDDQEESVRIAVKALGDMRNMNSTTTRSRAPSYSQPHFDSNNKLPPIILPPLSISSSPSSKSDNNNSIPSFPSTSGSTSVAAAPAPTSSTSNPVSLESPSTSPAFVSRMSHFPLVGSALRAYEQGKASSRVVKYGAEMVESSVKSISRPVIDRLPVNVNQLDEFACRQLDRLDKYRRPSTSGEHPNDPNPNTSTTTHIPSPADRDRGRPKLKSKTLDGSAVDDEDETQLPDRDRHRDRDMRENGGGRSVPKWLEATSPFVAPPPPPPDSSPFGYSSPGSYSRSSTPTREGGSERARSSSSYAIGNSSNSNASSSATENGGERQVAQRSRWQAMLLEAGGLSAALSEESMRRLKYCLQWLQYATAHIDAQILILRDFTASLQAAASTSPGTAPPLPRPPISEEHMRKLTAVRRDIVLTIRQVVDVVSKYAGGALPEPARGRVRGFILKLPQRWASRAGANGSAAGAGELGGSMGEGDREREVVTAAAGSGTGVVRRAGGQRRAAQRERGVDSASSASASASGLRSGASSAAVSPSSSPRVSRVALGGYDGRGSGGSGQGSGQGVSPTAALVASQRILTLATESLDMMRNVTSVVKDSLDRADAWVGRLRTVGIQRGDSADADTDIEGSIVVPSDSATVASSRDREREQEDFEFEFSNRMRYRQSHFNGYGYSHSRQGSTQSDSVQSSVEMEVDPGDGDREREGRGGRSPFFSAASSTAWGSSIPSTPGVGAPPNLSGSGSGGLSRKASALSMGHDTVAVHSPTSSVSGLPIGIGISAMSLGSRYGTPKSAVVGLPDEDTLIDGGRHGAEGDVLGSLKGDLKGSRYADEERAIDVKREAKVAAMREEEEEGMEVDA